MSWFCPERQRLQALQGMDMCYGNKYLILKLYESIQGANLQQKIIST